MEKKLQKLARKENLAKEKFVEKTTPLMEMMDKTSNPDKLKIISNIIHVYLNKYLKVISAIESRRLRLEKR